MSGTVIALMKEYRTGNSVSDCSGGKRSVVRLPFCSEPKANVRMQPRKARPTTVGNAKKKNMR